MRKLLRRVAGVLVDAGDSSEGAVGATDESDEGLDGGAIVEASGATPATSSANGDLTAVLASDFAAIYQQVGVAGDANADAMLTAYAGVAALPEDARRTAISAMATGMRVDPETVAALLTSRARALQAVASQARKRFEGEQQRRTTALASQAESARERIASLRAEIAQIESNLTQAMAGHATAKAKEDGTLNGFEQRVRTEVDRLGAIAQFFITLKTPKA